MPAPAVWIPKINDIVKELAAVAEIEPLVGSARIQMLLGVSPRNAQQILAPIITERRGKAGLATVEDVIRRLKELAGVFDPGAEIERRKRLSVLVKQWDEEIQTKPRAMVMVPAKFIPAITASDLSTIPGLRLSPGEVLLRFSTPQEGRLKLLALAMAMGRDQEGFDERVSLPEGATSGLAPAPDGGGADAAVNNKADA